VQTFLNLEESKFLILRVKLFKIASKNLNTENFLIFWFKLDRLVSQYQIWLEQFWLKISPIDDCYLPYFIEWTILVRYITEVE